MESILKSQPTNLTYGSLITLRNVAGAPDRPCWLHSHKDLYPKMYTDSRRRSSQQQQITSFAFKHPNNWWVIKNPNKTDLYQEYPPVQVVDGDHIELYHGITGQLLNR